MAEQRQDQILTIPEVAKYLKLSRSKVYSLVAKRTIPSLRMGRNVRIREADLKKWIESNLSASGTNLPIGYCADDDSSHTTHGT